MAEDLQGLLDRINKEGLEKAEADKAVIIAEAKSDAKGIIENANTEAEGIVSTAKSEAATLLAAGESGCRQASRDVLISLEGSIKQVLSSIVKQSVAESMTSEQLAGLISILAQAYVKGSEPTLEAMASPDQAESLKQAFLAKLADTFKGGIEVNPVPSIDAGVKVSFNGESVVYDFTADAVSDMLCAYLNPRILEIVSKSQEEQA
jgi:V/A-type H+-transporting ATPase subunit E